MKRNADEEGMPEKKPLFSKQDFMDDYDEENQYENEEFFDEHKQIVNNEVLQTPHKNKTNRADILMSGKLDYTETMNRRDISKLWEFPVKLGSYQSHSDLALEYIKYISAILELDEDITQCAFVLKKNTLRLIKVEEFSKETVFHDPCRTFILHDVICELCSNNKDFDFCRDKQILSNQWTCDLCHSQYDKQFIEFLVIHKVKNIIDYYFNQDLKCLRCKMQKNELVFTRCVCAGEFSKTFEESLFKGNSNLKTIDEYLENISNIANFYNFENLKAMLNQIRI